MVGIEDLGLSLDPSTLVVVSDVRDSIVGVGGSSLVGLYLYGSLVAGGFDREVSDIDFIAVLSNDPSEELTARLEAMHESLAHRHTAWAGRIEAVYVGARRLLRLHESIPRMAVISPGEPFHVVTAGRDWLLTWYPAREEAVALVGPPITTVIPELSREAFLHVVREHLYEFRTALQDDSSPGACAYTILTVCRGLYTLESGSRPSKLQAGEWVAEEFPEWAALVESALAWRKRRWKSGKPDARAIAETRRFVRAMTERIIA